MSTVNAIRHTSGTLFGQTRQATLSLLFGQPDEEFYVREIERSTNTGLGAVQRELKQLAKQGLITRKIKGNHVYYQANPASPIYNEVKSLIMKTSGAGAILKAALKPLAGEISVAFIYGSFARGSENKLSDIDLIVVGKVKFAELAGKLSKTHFALGREVNATVYPPEEFRNKIKSGHHFLNSVMKQKKIFLIGDKDELARLAE